jgi:hypothetical protein
MKDFRSTSQILFGFLPEQTVDLQGRVWKVREWRNPLRRNIDSNRLRRELSKLAAPWAANRTDGNYVLDLRKGHELRVLSLNREDGVTVDSFPPVWMCKECHRVFDSPSRKCTCGSKRFGQLPFVGYHDACGAVEAPYIPKCQEHNEVEVILPGTSSAAELKFRCPVCFKLLRNGFGTPKCNCGKGNLVFTVHRAARVYTPRTFVVINPPNQERHRKILEADGPSRALSWVLTGLKSKSIETALMTKSEFRNLLISTGLSGQLIESAINEAFLAGRIIEESQDAALDPKRRDEAVEEAVTIAIGFSESRMQIGDLAEAAEHDSPRRTLYRDSYPKALERSGLEDIELIEKFPILSGSFGYTRGGADPGASRLVPFRNSRNDYVVYADINETESLFIRLRASRIATWLTAKGFVLESWTDEISARLAIIRAAKIPSPGASNQIDPVGSALLTLIHSYSHRLIRMLAVHAGIERSSLSELLVPLHCGFFIYAASRGDFVLGGLQAVFETDLERVLRDFTDGDHRCALDPGCSRAGGACMACLHLGEPSCRYYNQFLDRSVLKGGSGFLP